MSTRAVDVPGPGPIDLSCSPLLSCPPQSLTRDDKLMTSQLVTSVKLLPGTGCGGLCSYHHTALAVPLLSSPPCLSWGGMILLAVPLPPLPPSRGGVWARFGRAQCGRTCAPAVHRELPLANLDLGCLGGWGGVGMISSSFCGVCS